jgi:drug/metabolite transporter (DMT)-like permease
MLMAALVFALMGMLIKGLGPAFRVWDVAMFRFVGGLVLLTLISGQRRGLLRPNRPWLMITRGIVGCTAFIAFVTALHLIPFSTATVIFFSFPAFAALFSAILFKSRVSWFEAACIAMAIIGAGVLFDVDLTGAWLGQALALLAGALAGLTVSMIKILRESNGPVIIYFYLCLAGAAVALAPFLVNPHWPSSSREWLMVGAVIVFATAGQLLMNQGFHYCQSWEGGLYMTSEVIFATLLGVLYFGEVLTGRFWMGGGLIFLSALAFNLRGLAFVRGDHR